MTSSFRLSAVTKEASNVHALLTANCRCPLEYIKNYRITNTILYNNAAVLWLSNKSKKNGVLLVNTVCMYLIVVS